MKFFKFNSLRVRLIALLLVAIIPAFGFLWYSSIRLKHSATVDAGERALHFAKVVAGNQEQIIEVTHQILHVFSRLPIVRSRDVDQCRQLFTELLQEYPYYSEFVLTATDGNVLTSSRPLNHTVNASDKAWFKRSMKTGDFSFGEFQTGRISKKQILVMGFPVRDESEKIVGVVAAGLDLDWLSNSLLSVDVPDYIHVEIIDNEGVILAHYPGDETYLGKKISDRSRLQTMFAHGSGTLLGNQHNTQYLYGYQLLRPLESETIVRIGIPLNIALSEANNIWHQGLIWLGISSVLAILVSWLGGSYFVVDKVNRLLYTTNEVAKGNLDVRTGIDSGSGELNNLARNFDRMTATLQAHEIELREREEKFRALVENTPDLILRFDQDLKTLYVNPAVEQFFNLTPSDFIGNRMQDIVVAELNADEETVQNWSTNLRQTIETGNEHKFEFQYESVEGTRYFYTFVVPEIVDDDEIQTILAVIREITPLKRAQEEARSNEKLLEGIFASLDEAVFLVNPEDRTIITCNQTTEKIFGYTPEELQGENTKLLHVDQERYEEFDEESIPPLESDGTMQTEFQMRRKDGSVFPTEHTVTILKDESGEWSGVVSVVRDITERKRTERELTMSRERLRSLTRHLQSIQEEERQSIARDIHDELGQMLTALQMDAIWLQRKLPDDMPEIYKKTESMYDLVDQSIETIQRISTDLRPSMLDDLGIEAVIQWEADKLEDRSEIECEIDIESDNHTLDEDISIALYRVLQESLTNVLRHAEATKVDISYLVTEDKVILVIKDNGKGISKEAVHNSESFGLSGMRERVEAWDGTFEIYGEDDKGTTVRATIPLI